MKNLCNQTDARLEALPFALKNASNIVSLERTEIQEHPVFRGQFPESNGTVKNPIVQFAPLKVGQIKSACLKCTPHTILGDTPGLTTLALQYAGGMLRHSGDDYDHETGPGDVIITPRNGSRINTGYFSGILFEIEHKRLQKTINSIAGNAVQINLNEKFSLSRDGSALERRINNHFWTHFGLVNRLLSESDNFSEFLGIDDQIYRLLALSLIEVQGKSHILHRRKDVSANKWANSLDDLVEYIRLNAHLNLTLTDLEEESHYSGRHLQNLFHEKFDCTPMQFVRRQRLSGAMERLETADENETVTNVARDFGYAYTSSFTTDFHREFGVTPSIVLRSSRGGRRR